MDTTTNHTIPRWKAMQTDETRHVEDVLRQAGFRQADAYRYNSASIRLRVIDPQFEHLSIEDRDALVEPFLDQLPERTQADIISLFTFAPSELGQSAPKSTDGLLNIEFEDPSPSRL